MSDSNDPRAIVFEKKIIDGSERVFVIDGWPIRALIEMAFITEPPPEIVVDGTSLYIRVANGFAGYRRQMAGAMNGDGVTRWIYARGESEFIAPERVSG